jgi:hypothetical protein
LRSRLAFGGEALKSAIWFTTLGVAGGRRESALANNSICQVHLIGSHPLFLFIAVTFFILNEAPRKHVAFSYFTKLNFMRVIAKTGFDIFKCHFYYVRSYVFGATGKVFEKYECLWVGTFLRTQRDTRPALIQIKPQKHLIGVRHFGGWLWKLEQYWARIPGQQ